jgi:cystatin-A/B
MPVVCGGTSAEREADAEIQSICDQLRGEVEDKSGKKFTEYTALKVCSQVVAGTNYFVKIHVGNEECVHARIFRPLPHTGAPPSVHSVQVSKTKHDQLQYF